MTHLTKPFFRDRLRRSGAAFELYVHSSPKARQVIINCPGYRGDIDGYNNKYRVLGAHLAAAGVGAVIQMPNVTRALANYGNDLMDDMRDVIKYASAASHYICAMQDAGICLMGFSAGGFAVAAVAAEFPQVKKILLMEPTVSEDLMGPFPRTKIGNYTGEAYIVVGDHDTVGPEAGKKYVAALGKAALCKMQVIADCDHQFTGTRNGQIMAKAPLWAFADDTTFPSPEGGLVLY